MPSATSTPTLETVPTDLDDIRERLHLKHWQRVHVEHMFRQRVDAASTDPPEFQSVSRRGYFRGSRPSRSDPRQIESILTPRQGQRIADLDAKIGSKIFEAC
jgi:hypothetical protein